MDNFCKTVRHDIKHKNHYGGPRGRVADISLPRVTIRSSGVG